jgi:outer membrane protein OmpA-like peptidoglycan-associated protein
MSAAGGDDEAFEKLRALLLGEQAQRLQDVETTTRRVESFVGDARRLESATSAILAGALRRAEVAQHKELANAIAPLIVVAIRSEIKNSKEMMIEALYPITGRLVKAAVAASFRELVDTINRRIDALVSANMWRLRMRALAAGKSVAEVALAEMDTAALKRALLLERGSGRALAHWPIDGHDAEKDDLASGLIAAISEFATQVYADAGGELRMMDFGASNVFLRASTRVIVAAEFTGKPSPEREKRLDEAFLRIVEAHDRDESGPEPERLGAELGEALRAEPPPPPSKAPIVVVGLGLAALAIWGSIDPATHWWRAHRINDAYRAALDANPGLADFPLRLDIDHAQGKVVLRGLTADETAPQAVLEAIAPAAQPYVVERDVKVVALDKDAAARGESLASALAEARSEIEKLRAERDAPPAHLQRLIDNFAVFFTEQDTLVDPGATAKGLDELARLLKLTGQELRVVGYGDETGTTAANRTVARKRAEKIANMLVERGVPREKLALAPRGALVPIADAGPGAARSRRVVFERAYLGEFVVK